MRASRILACILSVALAALSVPSHAATKRASAKQTATAVQQKPAKTTRVTAKALAKTARTEKFVAPSHARTVKRADVKARNRAVAAESVKHSAPVVKAVETEFDHEGMPLLKSSAFIVQDVATGKVLLEKNSSATQPIASISKLMTAMVVLDAHQDLSEVLEVTQDDVDTLKGTSSRLTVGTRLTREELLTLALMSSENRAASALSRNYPGGQPAFINAMNVKAKMMGMNDTRFFDASGLNKDNVSSARDLATMVSNASHYPLIREFSTQTEYTATVRGGRSQTFHNTNALVKSSDWQIDVQKTGYINESGKCLVMQAWMASKQVAIVLLDSWGKYTRLADANRIRKWVETTTARQNIASARPGVTTAN